MSSQENIESIDKYFTDQLSEDEKKVFEERLENDKELQDDVRLYQDVNIAIKKRDSIKFVDMAMENLRSHKKGVHIKKFNYSMWFKAAAILIVLVGLSIVIVVLTKKQHDETRTLASYFKAEEIEQEFRGDDDDFEKMILTGVRFYNNENYSDAIQQFQNVLQKDEGHIQVKYYLGLSDLFAGNLDKAETILKEIANSGDMNYSSGAQWYLSWCYIQEGKKELAISALKELKGDDYYGEKAEKVIEMLKKEN